MVAVLESHLETKTGELGQVSVVGVGVLSLEDGGQICTPAPYRRRWSSVWPTEEITPGRLGGGSSGP